MEVLYNFKKQVAAAAYNLTFQIGFATTQLCEALAIACQTLIARELNNIASNPAVKRRNV